MKLIDILSLIEERQKLKDRLDYIQHQLALYQTMGQSAPEIYDIVKKLEQQLSIINTEICKIEHTEI